MKHRDEIKYNQSFREEFYIMCQELGVDPLAGNHPYNKLKCWNLSYPPAVPA